MVKQGLGETKFNEFIPVATLTTEFKLPKGACVKYSAKRLSC